MREVPLWWTCLKTPPPTHVQECPAVTDAALASALPSLPALRTLILRGCPKVTAALAPTLARQTSKPWTLNPNPTSPNPKSSILNPEP